MTTLSLPSSPATPGIWILSPANATRRMVYCDGGAIFLLDVSAEVFVLALADMHVATVRSLCPGERIRFMVDGQTVEGVLA